MAVRSGLIALTLLLAGFAVVLLHPRLSASAVDRAARLVDRISPGLAHRLRAMQTGPLQTRLSAHGLRSGDPVFIRIFKEESQLEVWIEREGAFTLFETYPICAWSGDLGPKRREGDGQSPEGFYAVGLKQLNPRSAYHRAFDLGFPNPYDRAHGRTGSFLMVHGDCVSIGCYAMRDGAIEEIYHLVEAALRAGQQEVQVHAFPFRLSQAQLAARAHHPWAGEWAGLKEGYDLFETTRVPPRIAVCGRRYAVGPSVGDCTAITAW